VLVGLQQPFEVLDNKPRSLLVATAYCQAARARSDSGVPSVSVLVFDMDRVRRHPSRASARLLLTTLGSTAERFTGRRRGFWIQVAEQPRAMASLTAARLTPGGSPTRNASRCSRVTIRPA
jgi:hypothetical protein